MKTSYTNHDGNIGTEKQMVHVCGDVDSDQNERY